MTTETGLSRNDCGSLSSRRTVTFRSRRRPSDQYEPAKQALVAAAFSYAQSLLGILASFFITRLLVHVLGAISMAPGSRPVVCSLRGARRSRHFWRNAWLFAEAEVKRRRADRAA